MAQCLRLGVSARRRSHGRCSRLSRSWHPLLYIAIQIFLYLYRQELLKVGWFDAMWQETLRVEIRPGRKSWDRAEMAQIGQNNNGFLKRAENQNKQILIVVSWCRFLCGPICFLCAPIAKWIGPDIPIVVWHLDMICLSSLGLYP